MTPLTILYDEYIDRPKLTEQKKNPVEYIVPPSPLKWGSEQKNSHMRMAKRSMFVKFVNLWLKIDDVD